MVSNFAYIKCFETADAYISKCHSEFNRKAENDQF